MTSCPPQTRDLRPSAKKSKETCWATVVYVPGSKKVKVVGGLADGIALSGAHWFLNKGTELEEYYQVGCDFRRLYPEEGPMMVIDLNSDAHEERLKMILAREKLELDS